jgi:hypothetical protein
MVAIIGSRLVALPRTQSTIGRRTVTSATRRNRSVSGEEHACVAPATQVCRAETHARPGETQVCREKHRRAPATPVWCRMPDTRASGPDAACPGRNGGVSRPRRGVSARSTHTRRTRAAGASHAGSTRTTPNTGASGEKHSRAPDTPVCCRTPATRVSGSRHSASGRNTRASRPRRVSSCEEHRCGAPASQARCARNPRSHALTPLCRARNIRASRLRHSVSGEAHLRVTSGNRRVGDEYLSVEPARTLRRRDASWTRLLAGSARSARGDVRRDAVTAREGGSVVALTRVSGNTATRDRAAAENRRVCRARVAAGA